MEEDNIVTSSNARDNIMEFQILCLECRVIFQNNLSWLNCKIAAFAFGINVIVMFFYHIKADLAAIVSNA